MPDERAAIVTGASGQDGYFLTERLLREGWTVHAIARRGARIREFDAAGAGRLVAHAMDVVDEPAIRRLLREVGPEEIYNLAGQSSVSGSFTSPTETWRTNAEAVAILLEAVRAEAPEAKVYQASSGEMFGWLPGAATVHDEDSPLMPLSPYAAAKSAAHLLCGAYRKAYGLRLACGILFNHESHRRPGQFLSRKVVDHVRALRAGPGGPDLAEPLRVGNLAAQRDWGYAPDYVEGMLSVLRQVSVRAERLGGNEEADSDLPENYRDYVLATGRLHTVWELVDRAFDLAGLSLDWDMESSDVREWSARYRSNGAVAVEVDPSFLRPSDPLLIAADPARARRDLGWEPQVGLDVFLKDMLAHAV